MAVILVILALVVALMGVAMLVVSLPSKRRHRRSRPFNAPLAGLGLFFIAGGVALAVVARLPWIYDQMPVGERPAHVLIAAARSFDRDAAALAVAELGIRDQRGELSPVEKAQYDHIAANWTDVQKAIKDLSDAETTPQRQDAVARLDHMGIDVPGAWRELTAAEITAQLD